MRSIGTVIYNKKNEGLQMIMSYYPTEVNSGIQYEYLTCSYPIGYGDDLPTYFVNESDFDYIVHEGLESNEFDKLADAITKYINNSKQQQNVTGETKVNFDLSQFTEL